MGLYRGYEPARGCTAGPTPGGKALMGVFLGLYGPLGGYNGGIYNCATIPGSTAVSVHGEGRADDLMVPTSGRGLDGWGWRLANALRDYSAEMGVQLLIYNRKVWSGRYPDAGWRDYDGSNPHDDHIHAELCWWAANHFVPEHFWPYLNLGILPGNPVPPSAEPNWTEKLMDSLPELRRGSNGRPVKKAQALANLWGAGLSEDGDFGPRTDAGIRLVQREESIGVDGIVGPETWRVLLTR